MIPSNIFSNQVMWDNKVFVNLMDEYDKLTHLVFTDEELKEQYWQNYRDDLYRASLHWFSIFKGAEWHREGME